MLLLYIYGIARDSLISIAITLAMNMFISCMYTPKPLNTELVKVIKIILCSYKRFTCEYNQECTFSGRTISTCLIHLVIMT